MSLQILPLGAPTPGPACLPLKQTLTQSISLGSPRLRNLSGLSIRQARARPTPCPTPEPLQAPPAGGGVRTGFLAGMRQEAWEAPRQGRKGGRWRASGWIPRLPLPKPLGAYLGPSGDKCLDGGLSIDPTRTSPALGVPGFLVSLHLQTMSYGTRGGRGGRGGVTASQGLGQGQGLPGRLQSCCDLPLNASTPVHSHPRRMAETQAHSCTASPSPGARATPQGSGHGLRGC